MFCLICHENILNVSNTYNINQLVNVGFVHDYNSFFKSQIRNNIIGKYLNKLLALMI